VAEGFVMRIFVGMETSGVTRAAFSRLGHTVISCDILPADDGAGFPIGPNHSGHIQGDVFEALEWLMGTGNGKPGQWIPDLALFHPTCTMHTVSAAWAFNDPDYVRYPGIGYHQRVKEGTLTGHARRAARDAAEVELERIRMLPFIKAVENPRGTIPTRTRYGKPADVLQPYEFGDDASKATCIWVFDAKGQPIPFKFERDPSAYVKPTLRPNGKAYWANQTDTGQNKLSPGDDRWKERSATYPGIGAAYTQLTRLV
jgi:hypothetical protein